MRQKVGGDVDLLPVKSDVRSPCPALWRISRKRIVEPRRRPDHTLCSPVLPTSVIRARSSKPPAA